MRETTTLCKKATGILPVTLIVLLGIYYLWGHTYTKNLFNLVTTFSRPDENIVIAISRTVNSKKLVTYDSHNNNVAHRIIHADFNNSQLFTTNIYIY